MRKFVKIGGVFLGILVLVSVLSLVLLITFVSPSRVKPIIIDQVKKSTGRELTIDGDMSWTVFPYLGVKVGQMALSNPAEFQPKTFVEIKSATIGVKLLPLLRGRIQSNGMTLRGMKLYLIKNAQGKVNWDFPKDVAAEQTGEQTAAEKPTRELAISKLDISDAEVIYRDEQSQQSIELNQFDLQAKNINLIQPFPVKASFNLRAKQPAVSAKISLHSDAALNPSTQIYSFRNLMLTAKIQQAGKNIDLNVNGSMLVDLEEEKLQLTDLTGQMINMPFTGKMSVSRLISTPVATGHFHVDAFDLKKTLDELGKGSDALQIANNTIVDIDFSAAAKAVDVKINLTMDAVRAAKINIKDVVVQGNFQDGILNLSSITGNLYQGNLTGQAKINTNSAVPQISLQTKLAHIQAEPLLRDLGNAEQKLTVTGLGNITLNVTTAGTESKDIMRNLNGTTQFSFNNGEVVGIDLGYWVDSAYALAKKRELSATNTNRTHFGDLTGTAVIQNGVLINNDLLLDSPRFSTHGNGKINLVNQKIDFALQTTVKQQSEEQKNNLRNLYGISIPVVLTGSLNDLAIRVDTAKIAKTVAKEELEKNIDKTKEKLREQIQKKIPEAGNLLQNLLGS